jgi:hypothetical protein
MRAIGHCGTHSAALAPLIASMCIAPTRLRRHQYQYTQCQQQQREFYCGSSRHIRTKFRRTHADSVVIGCMRAKRVRKSLKSSIRNSTGLLHEKRSVENRATTISIQLTLSQCSTRNLVTKIKFPFLGRCFRPLPLRQVSAHKTARLVDGLEVHNPSAFFVDLPLGSAQ